MARNPTPDNSSQFSLVGTIITALLATIAATLLLTHPTSPGQQILQDTGMKHPNPLLPSSSQAQPNQAGSV